MIAVFDRLTRAAESRAWSVALAVSAPAWVTALRLLGERFLAAEVKGFRPSLALALHVFVFYLALLTCLGALLARLVPVDWKRAQNLVGMGLLLGVLPPLIDTAVLGRRQFSYEYASAPGVIPWSLSGPPRALPPGETTVLWVSVLFLALYTWRRTRSAARAVAVGLLGYGLVLLFLVGVPAFANAASQRSSLAPSDWHLLAMVVLSMLAVVIAVGGELRFLARLPQAALPVVFVLLGAALTGRVDGAAWLVAGAFFVSGLGFALSNDFHDRLEDGHVGRKSPIDEGAAALLSLIPLVPAAFILPGRLEAGLAAFAFSVVAHAYQADPLRLKCIFPLSYKTEGLLAGLAVVAGLCANPAVVPTAPQLWIVAAIGLGTPAALVFKDFKDVEGDARAGVQTAFVFGERRGWSRSRVLAISAVLLAVSLGVPFVGLTVVGAGGWLTWAVAAIAVAAPACLWLLRANPTAAVLVTMVLAELSLGFSAAALLPT